MFILKLYRTVSDSKSTIMGYFCVRQVMSVGLALNITGPKQFEFMSKIPQLPFIKHFF